MKKNSFNAFKLVHFIIFKLLIILYYEISSKNNPYLKVKKRKKTAGARIILKKYKKVKRRPTNLDEFRLTMNSVSPVGSQETNNIDLEKRSSPESPPSSLCAFKASNRKGTMLCFH